MVKASRLHAELQPGLPRVGRARLVGHEEALRTFPRIYDRVRRTTPGFISRSTDWWEMRKLDDRPERRRGAGELNRLLLEIDGRPAGYALYRIKVEFDDATNMSQVRVIEAIGDSPVAIRELWRYLLAIDWTGSSRVLHAPAGRPPALPARPAPEPARLEGLRRALAAPPRRRRRALGAVARRRRPRHVRAHRPTRCSPKTPAPGRSRPAARAAPRRRADVRLDVQALASAYLGGFTFADLLRAGRVEEAARGGHRARRRALPRRREAVEPRDLLGFRDVVHHRSPLAAAAAAARRARGGAHAPRSATSSSGSATRATP